VLQCVAVCCSVLQRVERVLHSLILWMCIDLYAVCCSVLQCVAVCCSVLQCVAACCKVLSVCCILSYYGCVLICMQCVAVSDSVSHVCFVFPLSQIVLEPSESEISYKNFRMSQMRNTCIIIRSVAVDCFELQ